MNDTERVREWRQKNKKKCPFCDSLIYKESKTCVQCSPRADMGHKTLGEYRNLESVKGKHPSWVYAHVRGMARSKFKKLLSLPCAHCGYSKHVELAHVKPLSSFPDSALLSEINSEENVIQLCPNCHWEFDNLPR